MQRVCGYCDMPIPDGAHGNRRHCSASHRVMAHHKRRRAAAALLMRQTEAVIAGDADELAAVERDAARLFGDAQ